MNRANLVELRESVTQECCWHWRRRTADLVVHVHSQADGRKVKGVLSALSTQGYHYNPSFCSKNKKNSKKGLYWRHISKWLFSLPLQMVQEVKVQLVSLPCLCVAATRSLERKDTHTLIQILTPLSRGDRLYFPVCGDDCSFLVFFH